MKLKNLNLKAMLSRVTRSADSKAGLLAISPKTRNIAIAALVYTTMIFAAVRPVLAEEMFNNQGVQFDEDTIVDFEFLQSHGAYQSTFGVMNLDTGEKTPLLAEIKPADTDDTIYRPSQYQDDLKSQQSKDFVGTPGNTVPKPIASFTFKAGNRYVFYLESAFRNEPAGMVYSTNSENLSKNQQVKFVGDLAKLGNGGITLRWDDTGSKLVRPNLEDTDFDDFVVGIGGEVECPYPSTEEKPNENPMKLEESGSRQ